MLLTSQTLLDMNTAYIETCINGYWQRVSSGLIENIQYDVDYWKKTTTDPVRAVDSNGRIVAI